LTEDPRHRDVDRGDAILAATALMGGGQIHTLDWLPKIFAETGRLLG
jgi:hypothetical protein